MTSQTYQLNIGSLPPPVKVIPSQSINPRRLSDLLPLQTPPVTLQSYPKLPSPPRSSRFNQDYSVTTHVFPAAYPRAPSALLVTPQPTEKLPRERIKQTVARLSSRKEKMEKREDIGKPRKEVLWTVANRYARTRPNRAPGPQLTIVLLHGIGAHKEIWEPILSRIFSLVDLNGSTLNIQEVWALECVQHGDSGLLNEPFLGDIFDCAEYTRDVTNFLLYYLPEETGKLPTNLSRLPESVVSSRRKHGYARRDVVGVGHSIGGCSFVCPAEAYPALFSSLIFLECMTIPEYVRSKDAHRKFEALCLGRKWVWNTREEAYRAIRESAYYRVWAPHIVETYLKYALAETADGKIRLKSHPWHEAVMLFERLSVYESWELLESLPRDLPLHWVWGGKSERSGGPTIQAQTSWRRGVNGGRDTNDFLPDVGHLLPQEAPDATADCVFRFLNERYGNAIGSKL